MNGNFEYIHCVKYTLKILSFQKCYVILRCKYAKANNEYEYKNM